MFVRGLEGRDPAEGRADVCPSFKSFSPGRNFLHSATFFSSVLPASSQTVHERSAGGWEECWQCKKGERHGGKNSNQEDTLSTLGNAKVITEKQANKKSCYSPIQSSTSIIRILIHFLPNYSINNDSTDVSKLNQLFTENLKFVILTEIKSNFLAYSA